MKNVFEKAAQAEKKRTDKMFSKHEFKTDMIKQKKVDEFIETGKLTELPLSSILDDNTFQIRAEEVSADKLAEMAESIKKQGQIFPAFARPKDGKFQLIAGFTRRRACQQAGVKLLKAIVKDVDDDTALIIAEVENMKRNELTFIDIYTHIKKLSEKFDTKHISERLGKDIRTIQFYLQIGENERLVKLVQKGITTFKEAIKLIRLEEKELNKALTKLESLTDKKEIKEVTKKITSGPVYISKAKDKIKINLSGTFKNKEEIIASLKEALKTLEAIK